MRALVVYESMFGNTEEVARAIAAGLADAMEVEVLDVAHAPARPGDDVDLLVAGGPTHAFSMTRESTRASAIEQGATKGAAGLGLREWLKALPIDNGAPALATFDTKVGKVRHLPGSAAHSAARVARHHGFRHTEVKPESFYVDDTEGPVLPGELDRATAWGRELADAAATA